MRHHLECEPARWRLLCCCHSQALGKADDVAESLQAIQAAVADFTAGAAGQRIADTFRPLITSRLANALVSVEGVEPGQETAVAQHVLAVGGVKVQQVFPWLWGGGAVAAQHLSLKGLATGEVLSFEQSGMQVRLLLRRQVGCTTCSACHDHWHCTAVHMVCLTLVALNVMVGCMLLHPSMHKPNLCEPGLPLLSAPAMCRIAPLFLLHSTGSP
jgi:hypothetical protein